MWTPADRIRLRHQEITDILSLYGARTVRIWGALNDLELEPDIDVLISFDEKDIAPILVCFRRKYLSSVKGENRWLNMDQDGFLLCHILSELLGFLVNACEEGAVKRFHPVTHSKTWATHKWE